MLPSHQNCYIHNSFRENVAQKFGLLFGNFKEIAQSKQTPKERKFAQSGHPGSKIEFRRRVYRVVDLKNI
jgi:hypothetical protein